MVKWTPFPFLRISFLFILGIIFGRLFESNQALTANPSLLLSGSALAFFLIAALLKRKTENHITGHWLLFAVFVLGSISYYGNSEIADKSKYQQKLEKTNIYSGTVLSYANVSDRYFVYLVETNKCKLDLTLHPVQAKIRLYEKREFNSSPSFEYGDKIIVNGNPNIISPPKNPHEFNYAAYMADQNIFFQHFVEREDIKLLSRDHGNPLLSAIYRLRHQFESTITSSIHGEKEQAIALALLLGIKDRLGTDTKQAYAATGAMHVLAVSGLHVGVIYFMLVWLFKPIRIRWVKEYFVPVFSILLLWLYAMLTGFSPSILRAVTMFSIVILGASTDRHTNIFNSLALSAFILLLVNPNNLFTVGFQLSYLAVTGIVYLYDKIYDLFTPRYWLSDKIWSLSCLSIAAQIATVPISIYYFHQFPTYFLFSNLIVIPLAFVIMVLGIGMLIFDSIPWMAWLDWCLEKAIWSLNQSIELIFQFKWSLLDWLYLSLPQTFFIYLFVIFGLTFLYFKKIRFVWFMTFSLLLVSLDGVTSIYLQSQKNELLFYHTRKNLLIDQINGLDSELLSLDTLKNWDLVEYHVEPHRLASHLNNVSSANTLKIAPKIVGDFACLDVQNQEKYLYVFKKIDTLQIHFKLDTDYLIVANNAFTSFDEIENYFQFKKIVFASTNNKKNVVKMVQQAEDKGYENFWLEESAMYIDQQLY